MSSFWILTASLLFALVAVFVKLASDLVGPMSFVFFRGLFGVVIVGIWAIYTGKTFRTPFLNQQLWRGTYGTVSVALWIYCLGLLPLGTGVTLNYTNPLFIGAIVVAGCLIKNEPVRWSLVLASLTGFAGVVLVCEPTFTASQNFAVILELVSALTTALAYLQIRKLALLKEPDWRTVFYFCSFNMVFGLTGSLLFGESITINTTSITAIFGVGITATIAQVAVTKAFSGGNILLTALLQYSGIVFATIIGIIFFGDNFNLRIVLGIVVIIVSSVMANLLVAKGKSSKT